MDIWLSQHLVTSFLTCAQVFRVGLTWDLGMGACIQLGSWSPTKVISKNLTTQQHLWGLLGGSCWPSSKSSKDILLPQASFFHPAWVFRWELSPWPMEKQTQ